MRGGEGSEFALELAEAKDDPEIRRLLAENPVPGSISLGYLREPDYFLGCGPLGDFCQTLLVRHRPSGRLAGIACRAARPLFVNGRSLSVGYLGQLRVDRSFRSRWLLSAGFRALRALHDDGRAPFYLTTLIEGNREAEGVLVRRPRRHFPLYRPLARLQTLALAAKRRRPSPLAGCELLSGDRVPLEDLLRFWAETGRQRQFFPAWRQEDFAPGAALTRGLRLEELLVAVREGAILGTLALWDQSAYKQSVVRGYSSPLRAGRPFYNLFARLAGRPRLPPVGSALSTVFGALLCVRGGSAAPFDALLEGALHRAAEGGRDWLLLGLCEGDPLLAVAKRRPHVPYRSTLYAVSWEDPCEPLDERPVHVEIAAL